MVKAVVTTVIGALIMGASAWGVHLSARDNDHEKRIAVVEEHQKVRDKAIDESLDELKKGQDEQRQDTKEILKRLPRR
jgi:Tfp pilus assembly protein PilO